MNRRTAVLAGIILVLILIILARGRDRERVAPIVRQLETMDMLTSYQPLVLHECGRLSAKRGLAWGGRGRDPLADRRLCLQDGAYSTSWDAIGGYFGARNLRDLPMLWGGGTTMQLWKDRTDRGYSDIMLGPNECDRPDQCDLPINEVALLMVQAMAWCPECQWITPSWSMATQCEALPTFLQYLKVYGGDPARFVGIGLHVYSWHWGLNVQAVFDRCKAIIPAEWQHLPLWVTEAGVQACDNTYPERVEKAMTDLLAALEGQSDVVQYMIYSPYHRREKFCDFVPLFDWDTHEITPAGWVVAR
jgi:hypothetical protein